MRPGSTGGVEVAEELLHVPLRASFGFDLATVDAGMMATMGAGSPPSMAVATSPVIGMSPMSMRFKYARSVTITKSTLLGMTR